MFHFSPGFHEQLRRTCRRTARSSQAGALKLPKGPSTSLTRTLNFYMRVTNNWWSPFLGAPTIKIIVYWGMY